MGLKDKVKEQALSLGDGQTMAGECPKCGRDDSFYITRDGNRLLFIDHSVHCGFKGSAGSNPGDVVMTTPKPPKVFKGELSKLTPSEERYFLRSFGLTANTIKHLRWGLEDDRVYFPQYNKRGMIAGYIARFYPKLTTLRRKGAKALWKNVASVEMELFFPTLDVLQAVREGGKVVLVEDYISALVITQQLGFPCCALGGTSVYPGHVHTLLDMGVRDVVFVLDADATTKAVKLRRELSLAMNSYVIPLLGPDPKDMSESDLLKLGDKLCELL